MKIAEKSMLLRNLAIVFVTGLSLCSAEALPTVAETVDKMPAANSAQEQELMAGLVESGAR